MEEPLEFKVIDPNVNTIQDEVTESQANFNQYIVPMITAASTAADAATGFPIFGVLTQLAVSIVNFKYADKLVKTRCMIIANFLTLYTNEFETIVKTVDEKEGYIKSQFYRNLKIYEIKCTKLFLYLLENVFSKGQMSLMYEHLTGQTAFQDIMQSESENVTKISTLLNPSTISTRMMFSRSDPKRYENALIVIEDVITRVENIKVTPPGSQSTTNEPNEEKIPSEIVLNLDDLVKSKYSLKAKMVYIIEKKLNSIIEVTRSKNEFFLTSLKNIKDVIKTKLEFLLSTSRNKNAANNQEKAVAKITINAELQKLIIINNNTLIEQTAKAFASMWDCLSEFTSTDLERITSMVERDYESINAYTHVIGLSYTSFVTNAITEERELDNNAVVELEDKTTRLVIDAKRTNDRMIDNFVLLTGRMREIGNKTTELESTIRKREDEINDQSENLIILNDDIDSIKDMVSGITEEFQRYNEGVLSIQTRLSTQGSVTVDDINDKNIQDAFLEMIKRLNEETKLEFTLEIRNRCSIMEENIKKLLTYTGESEMGRTTMIQDFDESIKEIVIPISDTIYERKKNEIQTLLKTLNGANDNILTSQEVSRQLVNENILAIYNKLGSDTTPEKFKYTLLAVMHKYGKEYNTVRFSILHTLMLNLNYTIFQVKLREYVTYNKMFLMSCFDFLTVIDNKLTDEYLENWKKIFGILEKIPGVVEDNQRQFVDSYTKFIGNSANIDILLKTNIIALSLTDGEYVKPKPPVPPVFVAAAPPLVAAAPPLEKKPKEKPCNSFTRLFRSKSECDRIERENEAFGVVVRGGTRRRHFNTKKQLKRIKIKTRLKKKGTRKH